MYAIIRAGGQQHQVSPATVISVNRLALDEGAAFETDQVLLLEQEGAELRIGKPLVAGAVVRGKVLRHERGPKVVVFKQKRRKNYRRKRGHRQELTRVLIEGIELDGQLIASVPAPEPKAAKPAAAKTAAETPAAKPARKPKAASEKATLAKAAAGKRPAAKAAAGKTAAKAKPAPKAAAGKTTRTRTSAAKSGSKGAAKPKTKKD